MKTKTCTTNIWPLTKTHFEYDTESSVFCVQYTVQTRLTDFTLQNYNFIIQPFRFHSKIQHLIELLFDNCSFRSSRRSWFSTLSLASAHILFLSLSGQQHWKWILGLTFGSDCFKSCSSSSSSSKLLSSFLFTSWILAFVQTPFGLVKRFLSCMCVCLCCNICFVSQQETNPKWHPLFCYFCLWSDAHALISTDLRGNIRIRPTDNNVSSFFMRIQFSDGNSNWTKDVFDARSQPNIVCTSKSWKLWLHIKCSLQWNLCVATDLIHTFEMMRPLLPP